MPEMHGMAVLYNARSPSQKRNYKLKKQMNIVQLSKNDEKRKQGNEINFESSNQSMIDMHIYRASHISWKVPKYQNPTSTTICIIIEQGQRTRVLILYSVFLSKRKAHLVSLCASS
jgi:hypothetical protein